METYESVVSLFFEKSCQKTIPKDETFIYLELIEK